MKFNAKNKNVFDTLTERGFIKQTVYEQDLYKLLGSESVPFYCGFDPTADSLHIGHYIPVMAAAHMQRAGHKPIILVGGGTVMIGDPSGRADMRPMLTREDIDKNVAGIKKQLERFVDFEGENGAVIVNNADWLLNLNYVDFLRSYGAYLSVNKMLTADCFKTRLEKGLSFLEFNYMPMQAYDFLHLFRNYGVKLEIGGNDQWSNILAGEDFIRRVEHKDAYAMTFSLLLTKDGKKMGKTQKGALWLDAERTTPYELYQYFRNVDDTEVEQCLMFLTFLPVDEVKQLVSHKDERINEAKKRLAYEVVALVHGKEAADKALSEAVAAFEGGSAQMPTLTTHLSASAPVVDLLAETKLAASKSEARRLIEGGGVRIDGNVVSSVSDTVEKYSNANEFVLNKGKKVRVKIVRE